MWLGGTRKLKLGFWFGFSGVEVETWEPQCEFRVRLRKVGFGFFRQRESEDCEMPSGTCRLGREVGRSSNNGERWNLEG